MNVFDGTIALILACLFVAALGVCFSVYLPRIWDMAMLILVGFFLLWAVDDLLYGWLMVFQIRSSLVRIVYLTPVLVFMAWLSSVCVTENAKQGS